MRGEGLAAEWYVEHGYDVVARNWRCREGEIDLVVAGHGAVVFCEVKARSSDRYGLPAEAVTPAKQRRLRQLAARFLAEDGAGTLWLADSIRLLAVRADTDQAGGDELGREERVDAPADEGLPRPHGREARLARTGRRRRAQGPHSES